MFEQHYQFSFEAAHQLAAAKPGEDAHPYARLHGHSYVATIVLAGPALTPQGWLYDFADLRAICAAIHERLDHRILNEVEGLDRPTLENTAAWIFRAAAETGAPVKRVEVARPTLGERVTYEA